MDAQAMVNSVWEPLCRAARGWLDTEAELDRFAARVERVLARRPGAARAAGDQAADGETFATPPAPTPSQQTMLVDAATAAMATLPEVPVQTQLPFAELIYPMPGTRHASTLVYRAGERVFKIALDARLSAEPLACLSEQYIAGLPADAWVERHAQGLEPGSVARERIVGALYDRLLEALAVVHRVGIIHRDIHPENILVNDAGAVHLIDFGCAITLAEADAAARERCANACSAAALRRPRPTWAGRMRPKRISMPLLPWRRSLPTVPATLLSCRRRRWGVAWPARWDRGWTTALGRRCPRRARASPSTLSAELRDAPALRPPATLSPTRRASRARHANRKDQS